MKVRRVAVFMLVVLAVVAAVELQGPACHAGEETPTEETPTATQYVVIVPPEPGKTQCRIVPDPRKLETTQSITFVNLSDEMILIALPPALFGPAESNPFVLENEKASHPFPLVDPKPGEYIYSVTAPKRGCLTDLPTPKIVIP